TVFNNGTIGDVDGNSDLRTQPPAPLSTIEDVGVNSDDCVDLRTQDGSSFECPKDVDGNSGLGTQPTSPLSTIEAVGVNLDDCVDLRDGSSVECPKNVDGNSGLGTQPPAPLSTIEDVGVNPDDCVDLRDGSSVECPTNTDDNSGLGTQPPAPLSTIGDVGVNLEGCVDLRDGSGVECSRDADDNNDLGSNDGITQDVVGNTNMEINNGSNTDTNNKGSKIPVTEFTRRDRSFFSCGGAPISKYHILTAAHCVPISRRPKYVRLGEDDFNAVDDSKAYDYEIADIITHPGYQLPRKYNDIAIITLAHEIDFTDNIQPFCLPQKRNLDGETCSVYGWGTRPNRRSSSILRNIKVDVVNREECDRNYMHAPEIFTDQYPEGITDLILCAGGTNDVCRGDSGGPLVFSESVDKEEEVGVVSTGYGCGAARFPGIYTRVDQYLDWIHEVIMGNCEELNVTK
ncbi:unnamed protein product, partial [Meganyctiphanes norvegica]